MKEVFFEIEMYKEEGEEPDFHATLYWEDPIVEGDETNVPEDLLAIIDEYIDWGGEEERGKWYSYCSIDELYDATSISDVERVVEEEKKKLDPIFEKYGYKFITNKILVEER